MTTLDARITRIVRTETGNLAGAADALVLRVESVRLSPEHSDAKPDVTVFILDRVQAYELQQQLLEALAGIHVSRADR